MSALPDYCGAPLQGPAAAEGALRCGDYCCRDRVGLAMAVETPDRVSDPGLLVVRRPDEAEWYDLDAQADSEGWTDSARA